jgi:uncharacterized membrane protein
MKDSVRLYPNPKHMKQYSLITGSFAALCGLAFLAPFAKAEDKVDFEKQVWPILKAKCLKCHNDVDDKGAPKKPKGGLLLKTAEGIKKGGKESGAKTVVAGKGAESSLYTSTTLPQSDEMAMPPEGKGDPLTKDEQALLKKWIDEGASFGAWTTAK